MRILTDFFVFMLTVMAAQNGVQGQELVVQIQADHVVHPVSRYLAGACIEDVNQEIYGGIYSQMIFGESFQEPATSASIPGFTKDDLQISGMWRAVRRGSAAGRFSIVSERPFVGGQSAAIDFRFWRRGMGY